MGRRRVFKGDRLLLARQWKGMSQEDLEGSARLGKGLIHRYENGKSDPSMEVIVKLAETLEVSVDWLLGLVDEPNARLINAYRSREVQEMLRIINEVIYPPKSGGCFSILKLL